jgi:hypothetical protein
MRHVSRVIQGRDVSERLYRDLTRRARALVIDAHLLRPVHLQQEVARPPRAEALARTAKRRRLRLKRPVAELIREERAARVG